MIKTPKQPASVASTHPRTGRAISTTLPEASDFGDQTTGGEGLTAANPEAWLRHGVRLPVRNDPDAPAGVRTNASWTEGFARLLGDPPLRMLIADATPASTRTAGVTASAVAALLSGMGIETRTATPAGLEELLPHVTDAAPHYVMLVLHTTVQRHCAPNGADAWERPALLTRAYHEAGVPVIVLSIGGSAAALAACVGNGALAVFDIEQLPSELVHIAEARRDNGGDNGRGRDGYGQGEPGHRKLPPTFEKLIHLTPTERRVLYHLTEGLPASDIARGMIVSLSTVRAHIRSILRKLDVGSQLAAVAIANGSELSADPHPTRS